MSVFDARFAVFVRRARVLPLLFHLIVHWTCAGGAGGVDDGDDGVPSLLVVVVATFPPSWW